LKKNTEKPVYAALPSADDAEKALCLSDPCAPKLRPRYAFLPILAHGAMRNPQLTAHQYRVCRKVGIDGRVGRNVHQFVDKRKRCVQSPSLMMALEKRVVILHSRIVARLLITGVQYTAVSIPDQPKEPCATGVF
jgi:hypothetical protein